MQTFTEIKRATSLNRYDVMNAVAVFAAQLHHEECPHTPSTQKTYDNLAGRYKTVYAIDFTSHTFESGWLEMRVWRNNQTGGYFATCDVWAGESTFFGTDGNCYGLTEDEEVYMD